MAQLHPQRMPANCLDRGVESTSQNDEGGLIRNTVWMQIQQLCRLLRPEPTIRASSGPARRRWQQQQQQQQQQHWHFAAAAVWRRDAHLRDGRARQQKTQQRGRDGDRRQLWRGVPCRRAGLGPGLEPGCGRSRRQWRCMHRSCPCGEWLLTRTSFAVHFWAPRPRSMVYVDTPLEDLIWRDCRRQPCTRARRVLHFTCKTSTINRLNFR